MHRELSEIEIDQLLATKTTGHLACQEAGKPYIVPLAYYYDRGVLYGQTMTGKKTEILHKNPYVCFQVQDLTQEGWQSALCWGMFEEIRLADPMSPELIETLAHLSARLGIVQQSVGITVAFTLQDGHPIPQTEAHGTIFRILVTEKSGRAFTAER